MFFAKETCMSDASRRFSPSSTENAAFRRCLATRKNEPTLETSERKQGLAPRRQSIFGRTKAATHYQTKPSQPEKNWQSVPAPLPNETCMSAESRRFSPEDENASSRAAASPLEKTNPLWRAAKGNKGQEPNRVRS